MFMLIAHVGDHVVISCPVCLPVKCATPVVMTIDLQRVPPCFISTCSSCCVRNLPTAVNQFVMVLLMFWLEDTTVTDGSYNLPSRYESRYENPINVTLLISNRSYIHIYI